MENKGFNFGKEIGKNDEYGLVFKETGKSYVIASGDWQMTVPLKKIDNIVKDTGYDNVDILNVVAWIRKVYEELNYSNNLEKEANERPVLLGVDYDTLEDVLSYTLKKYPIEVVEDFFIALSNTPYAIVSIFSGDRSFREIVGEIDRRMYNRDFSLDSTHDEENRVEIVDGFTETDEFGDDFLDDEIIGRNI